MKTTKQSYEESALIQSLVVSCPISKRESLPV